MIRRIGLSLPLFLLSGCAMDGSLTINRACPPACPTTVKVCDQGREAMRYVPLPATQAAPLTTTIEGAWHAAPAPPPPEVIESTPEASPPAPDPTPTENLAPVEALPPAAGQTPMGSEAPRRWLPVRKLRSS